MAALKSRTVKLGDREVTFPSEYLGQLESVEASEDRNVLLQKLEQDGYLYVKQLHKREEVLAARLEVIRYIAESGDDKFDPSQPLQRGVLNPRCGLGCVPFMEGKNDITHNKKVKKVLEGERPKKFFKKLLQEDVQTFDFKWLRGVYTEGFTGAHMDSVYMSWGTKDLYTMWTPFDDIPVEMGTLAMCQGSHSLPRSLQDTYGNFDVEKSHLKGTGWFTTDPFEITELFGGQWKTSDVQAGDVLIFKMRMIHMSTVNCTNKIRISCDTRWLRISEEPDPRYVGDIAIDGKFGVWAENDTKTDEDVTMEAMKEKWGFKNSKYPH